MLKIFILKCSKNYCEYFCIKIFLKVGFYKKISLVKLKIRSLGKFRKKILGKKLERYTNLIQAGNSRYECYLSYALFRFVLTLRDQERNGHKGQKPHFPP